MKTRYEVEVQLRLFLCIPWKHVTKWRYGSVCSCVFHGNMLRSGGAAPFVPVYSMKTRYEVEVRLHLL